MSGVYYRASGPLHTERLLTIRMVLFILKRWIKSGILLFQDSMTKHILSSAACIIPVNNVLDKSFPSKAE